MASKANPPKYDCYKNAEDEEEMFVLLGRDDFGGTLVRIWVAARCHNWFELHKQVWRLMRLALIRGATTNVDKIREATECADRMDRWNYRVGGLTGRVPNL